MTTALWIMAFVGVAIIYFGEKAAKLIAKKELNSRQSLLLRSIGVILAAAAMIVLYNMGSLV